MRPFHLLVFALPVLWFGLLLFRTPASDVPENRPDHDQLVRKNVHILESEIQKAKAEGGTFVAEQAADLVHKLAWGCEAGCRSHEIEWTVDFKGKDDGGWTLECRPDVAATYAQPFLTRLVTADFSQHLWPSFRLTSEGEHVETPPAGVTPWSLAGRAGVALVISMPYWLLTGYLLIVVARRREAQRAWPVIVEGFGKPPARGGPSR